VIDWDEAMQQCGDDEEFLLELLGDLRDETDLQMVRMEEVLKNPGDQTFVAMVRAAHVIKGAASNLMCEQLRQTSMALETDSQTAVNNAKDKLNTKNLATVAKKFQFLKVAVKKYHEYLEELNI